MAKKLWLSILFTLIILLLPTQTFADTLEFLTYTPPSGWIKSNTNDAVVFRRPTGVGAIALYNSYPTNGTAATEFAKIWSVRVGGIVRGGPVPQPKLERDGEYSVALGAQRVTLQDGEVSISMVAIVGNGKALGITTFTRGDDALREATTFLDSVKLMPMAGAAAATPTGSIDLDFTPPPGYTSQRDGQAIVLKPVAVNRETPCVYGISPSRPSKGNAEMDARDALLEPLPGWQVKGNVYSGMRGKSADGWDYLWLRTDVQRPGPSYQYLAAMSMAIEMDGGRVAIVWGFGDPAHCLANDIHFARLFSSLKVRGWVSDGGRGLMKQLVGTWRNTEYAGMAQYRFLPNGRYEYGQGTSTTFGNLETRTGSVGEGSYSLQGSRLVLTGGKRAGSYLVRVYEEFSAGMWLKAISIINTSSNPPLEVRYVRVQD